MDADGLLVLDKPRGITSRDALDRALRWFPRKTKLGHTGTLDPLATGVLVLCGKGTYIRSLARDLGEALGVGAYVLTLRRTRVGPFTPEQASREGDVRPMPSGLALAELPRVEVDAAAVVRLRQGQAVAV